MNKVTAWFIVAGVGVVIGLLGCYIAGGWGAFGIGLGVVGSGLVILAVVMLIMIGNE